jgi:hypothetical protein
MLKIILPLAALIAFTACSKDADDTAAEDAAATEEIVEE